MAQKQESGPAEGGLVECLFELRQVRSKIITARSRDYTHRFADLFQTKAKKTLAKLSSAIDNYLRFDNLEKMKWGHTF